ncbi:glycosyltransferase family 4 protein [Persicimonas caeni]|uniref:Glycosyltransferase family 4 protein n=1 Tax=Persicimonas caeni TaxID=2292766 RepID=A0A4Y6PTL6_PERCE|nr:glycosyltransferase family 4 protein [Persicimonas caeni]QDG51674.1 glycosyltransferase family 4 protein [Persicimonas caeni]QED32895.1 glycosyltransferase family 4 protein [Persicimonas caeni]
MKIVVIHQYFLRPEEGGGSRFNEMTRFWVEQGHEVTVIAGQVHYATGEKPAEYKGKMVVEEWQDGVRVLRAYTPSTFHQSILGRMWAFGGFGLGASLALMTHIDDADVVLATSPSLLVLVPGLLAKSLRGWPLIFEVRDLWPESAVSTGVLSETSPVTQFAYWLEETGYRAADKINVLTPAFRQNIVERGLAGLDKISFIPNGADVDLFTPGPADPDVRERYGWQDKFVVLYAGAHGIANHLWQLIDAAEILRERGRDDIILASVGNGPQKADLIAETESRGLTNMQWLDAVSKTEMPGLLRAADVGAAVLKRVDTFKTVYPNKIFDYMACARPTLLAIDGVAREVIEEQAESGIFVEPERPEELADTVEWMVEHPDELRQMGERGRRFVEENFARPKLAARYLEVMKEVVGDGSRR